MTAATLTIPDGLLEGCHTGDEQAIEKGFRDLYPAMLREAAQATDDAATASRIVERAFLYLLQHSQSAPTAGDLEALLHTALHQSAVREQSRRAAIQRFEHNEGVSDHSLRRG